MNSKSIRSVIYILFWQYNSSCALLSFTLMFDINSSWSLQQFSHWGWTFSLWVVFRFVPRSLLPFTAFPKLLLIFMKACNGRMGNSSLRFAIYFLFTHNLKFGCSVFWWNWICGFCDTLLVLFVLYSVGGYVGRFRPALLLLDLDFYGTNYDSLSNKMDHISTAVLLHILDKTVLVITSIRLKVSSGTIHFKKLVTVSESD